MLFLASLNGGAGVRSLVWLTRKPAFCPLPVCAALTMPSRAASYPGIQVACLLKPGPCSLR